MTTVCACGFTGCNGPVDYWIEQGGDWIVTDLVLTDSSGNPINLTGATITLQSRPYPGMPLTGVSMSSGGSEPAITIVNATAGEISWDLPGAITGALQPALNTPVGFRPDGTASFLGYYDLVVTSAAGVIDYYQHGKLLLRLGITNIARTDGEITLPVYP